MTANDHTDTDADAPRNRDTNALATGRRRFMKAVGAGALVGTVGLGPATGAASADMDSFVETDGTEFVVDGEPVYFSGTNNFWITDHYSMSEQRIDDCFQLFADLGIDLVRIWAHGEAKEGPLGVQPEPGQHNEEALALHDYVIETAKEHGIRLIVTLVDNWEHEGGMLQYAEWTGGSTRHHFYTNQEARDLYTNHVETIVTRENSISGVEWRNDPTIMMWELANEPRLEADDTDQGELDRDTDEHKDILGAWFADMSSYIKSLDDNHLVSTGSEGHYYGGYDDEYPYGNWDGQSYIDHHAIDTIDAASFHWYPDHWNMDLDHGTQWITEHVEDAHQQLGKPAYLGEFNVNIDNGLERRNELLEEWYATADEVDCNAVLPWQIVLDDTEDHDGFQLYRDESGDIIENYSSIAAEKSGDSNGGSGDEPPAIDGTVPQDTTGDGLSNDFDGSGSTTTTDVNVFFENVDNPDVADYPEYYDFDGNGQVSVTDVVELFDSL
ncbi:glycoside hydrolase family 2 TIM barrel-domain containing protein [Halomontanus rarus]|uniref:glycoside hydrolase family 2 TIM barrel-domain containing protein n=1 Tax=Halomontanus rarus TaxID=3034020 RepID=UPI001A99D425